jgi:hypothetical protein
MEIYQTPAFKISTYAVDIDTDYSYATFEPCNCEYCFMCQTQIILILNIYRVRGSLHIYFVYCHLHIYTGKSFLMNYHDWTFGNFGDPS